ncbi:hypothetical protein [Coprobacillus cateniformis]|uniref:hypothetical protein n=1 Tax=Coprobacillaceae TaxID=2810280 RepID=UPI0039A0CC1E
MLSKYLIKKDFNLIGRINLELKMNIDTVVILYERIMKNEDCRINMTIYNNNTYFCEYVYNNSGKQSRYNISKNNELLKINENNVFSDMELYPVELIYFIWYIIKKDKSIGIFDINQMLFCGLQFKKEDEFLHFIFPQNIMARYTKKEKKLKEICNPKAGIKCILIE